MLESASAETVNQKKQNPFPCNTIEENYDYHVPEKFSKVYKSLLDRNDEKLMERKTLKNPAISLTRKRSKVLRFAMQRPANYLTEIETYLEKALAEALEEEKTA